MICSTVPCPCTQGKAIYFLSLLSVMFISQSLDYFASCSIYDKLIYVCFSISPYH